MLRKGVFGVGMAALLASLAWPEDGQRSAPTVADSTAQLGGSSPAFSSPKVGRLDCECSPVEDTFWPESFVADWSQPVRLTEPINTSCPEDAIEISRDGTRLWWFYSSNLGEVLQAEGRYFSHTQLLTATLQSNGAWTAPVIYDLSGGVDSADGETCHVTDGTRVYFHSNRAANTGYQMDPFVSDPMDIYVSEVVNGVPGNPSNVGSPINTQWLDGEQFVTADGENMYLSSNRPGGLGGVDIWVSHRDAGVWSEPVCLPAPINSAGDEIQPWLNDARDTIYFSTTRSAGHGIYRSYFRDGTWTVPEYVMGPYCGETTITTDGRRLYFVHVTVVGGAPKEADIWYSERVGAPEGMPLVGVPWFSEGGKREKE